MWAKAAKERSKEANNNLPVITLILADRRANFCASSVLAVTLIKT
jgi:hypothetical protein